MRPRLGWKPLFYGALLPLLRRFPAPVGDALLTALGRVVHAAWPPRRAALAEATRRARAAGLALDRPALAGHVARFLARDGPLDGLPDDEALGRFEVVGDEYLRLALAGGRGVVVLGSHLGAHVAALHWMYRRGAPLRLLVQRPRHVSEFLRHQFDRADGPHPQSALFLRRDLTPREAAERLLAARAALRDGMAVYLSGDVPWPSGNARPGRLLGDVRPILATWADLAAQARCPVVPVFCTHRPGGRYALKFGPPWTVEPGTEGEAVARYLDRLGAEIAAHPSDAVAHLTWPCYGPPVETVVAPPNVSRSHTDAGRLAGPPCMRRRPARRSA